MTDSSRIYYSHHEPQFYVLIFFPEIYIHFETFSNYLLCVHVLVQWMVILCAAITEINHTCSSLHHIFLELVSLKTGLQTSIF